jgi:GrpB-like predicted nucleotidyltransferase (UPF0157 family)
MIFLNPDKYQSKCYERFIFYKSQLESLLPTARVEHIGSSSISGAISKGDLDIFIGVDACELDIAIQKLIGIGFQIKQNTLRTPELCMLESLSEDIAFQVVANDSEFESFLIFRDRMSADSRLVIQYNEMKRSCQGIAHEEYRNKKSVFIQEVLK